MAYEDVDVVVIGSGASGGLAAWNLTRKGVKVLMLEAGPKFSRGDYWTHMTPWKARQWRREGKRPPQFEQIPLDYSPYQTPQDKPFALQRVWGVGGKTNIWGRVSLRYSQLNFSEPEVDGWEIPWPIRYDEIAPYYDNVEKLIGVCGGDEDVPFLPGSKNHMPPPAPRCGEILIRDAGNKLGYPIIRGRRAVLTQDHRGFQKCHYCGACGRGCDTASFFASADHLIPQALETGNLELIENAVVARIVVNDEGLASGVQYFDRNTGEERTIPAKRVIVGASCVDTTRLLLNSKSRQYPNGIGNGSDVIGRYLVEQFRFHVEAYAPQLFGKPASNDDGISGGHIYMPRFELPTQKRDYLRGFSMQLWGVGCSASAPYAKSLEGFGSSYKQEVKKRYPSILKFHPYGEVLPYRNNRITVEGTPNDRYGVPTMRIEYEIGENERKMAKRMYDMVEEIVHELGAEPLPYKRGALDNMGAAIHEHGTVRMGADPKRSALNDRCQMHEVKNVFVVDGSAFPTATEKNPTLTILALSWRASDYLAEQMKKGEI